MPTTNHNPVALLLGCKQRDVRLMLVENDLLGRLYPTNMPIIISMNKEMVGWGATTVLTPEIYSRMLTAVLDGLAAQQGLDGSWRSQVDVVIIGLEFERESQRELLLEVLDLSEFTQADVLLEHNRLPYLTEFKTRRASSAPPMPRPEIAVLEESIKEIGLSVRASNCLARAGLYTIYHAVVLSVEEPMWIPNFGKRSLQDLEEVLAAKGLALGMELQDISVLYDPPLYSSIPQASFLRKPLEETELDAATVSRLKKDGFNNLMDLCLTPSFVAQIKFGGPDGFYRDSEPLREWLVTHLLELNMTPGELIDWQTAKAGGMHAAQLLSLPIEELNLGMRAETCLKRIGVEYIADLTSKTKDELSQVPNAGRKVVEEIEAELAKRGLSLASNE